MAEPIRALLQVWRSSTRPRAGEPSGGDLPPAMETGQQIPEATRDLLESLTDPLLVLDSASRVIFANRGSELLIRPGGAGKHVTSVLRTPELVESVERVQAGGAAETVSFHLPVPVERHFEATVTRSAQSLLLIQLRDVTEIRRTEQLRADFVANASHELRTPLASLTGFIDTLRGHAKDDPQARELFLQIMSNEAARMRRLIEDLLSLTKIELNEHNPPIGDVDLVSVARDAAAALQPLAESDAVQIEIAGHPELRVAGDRDELTQVFQNLIHNALKYGRKGGRVRIHFGTSEPAEKKSRNEIFIAVQDEGEGIPRELIPRLTERFYRADARRSRERGGTGLGLAIVKHILNRHNGRLEIRSTPEVGSVFTVWLPVLSRDVS